MTSSVKPEVHNVSLRRQRRTEPQPWVQQFADPIFGDMLADRQTHTHRHTRPDRQTDTDITILRTPMGAAKNYIKTDETIEVVVCCVDSGGLRLLRPRIRWGSIIPTRMGTFKRHDCASPDLSAVDILYIIRKRAAAMQLLDIGVA